VNIRTIEGVPIQGKRVLIRTEFNVPLDQDLNVTDDTRIRAALPTIENAVTRGARVILGSHRGRPWGKRTEKDSLGPVAKHLSQLVGKQVLMANDCIGDETKRMVEQLKDGEILMLENIRFHTEENENTEWFAKELASLADVYVDDAFGSLHRSHASIVGVPRFVPIAVIGFLVKKELEFLEKALRYPDRPSLVVTGGAKISGKDGKIWVIRNLLDKTDTMLIGGKIACTFLKAKGFEVGDSLIDQRDVNGAGAQVKDDIEMASDVLQKAESLGTDLVLPVDAVVADKFDSEARLEVVPTSSIPDGWMMLDIGPKTSEVFSRRIKEARTVIWNGPMGVFEMEPFKSGTKMVATAIAEGPATSIIGGGDVVAAVNELGLGPKMTHISTGGGAMLAYLMGRDLPGLTALTDKHARERNG